MADADEDALPRSQPTPLSSSSQPHAPDTDPSDETQDFRFLVSSSSSQATDQSFPKRGEKDFEPLSLISQTAALDASRRAMHTALSFPRIHTPKHHIVGVYLEAEEKWYGGTRMVRVRNFGGSYARTTGVGDARNAMWLTPEEALYLLERGSLDVVWPDENEDSQRANEGEGEGEDCDKEEDVGGLPMSLQGAYASFMGKSGLTLERYVVFAGLRRSGYVVTRASTWSDEDIGLNGHARHPEANLSTALTSPSAAASGATGLINRLLSWLFTPKREAPCPAFGPLVAPGLYRNYNDIFRALALVPYHDVSAPQQRHPQLKPPFRIAYNVWKPSTPYKKTSHPPPDFRVAVVDARSSGVPTIEQIGALLNSMPDDELPEDKRLEQRIKHGKKNVTLAVVDSGVVSYLRFSEAGFGSAKLFEQKTSRGGKKGGNRGRGKSR